jgi:hypothetical protein
MAMVHKWTFSRRAILAGGLAAWLTGCSSGRAGDLTYQVMVDQTDNRLSFSRDGDTVWADVHSPRGIGQALVYLATTTPVALRLRLHLTGLEHFRLWWDGRTVTASVALADPSSVQVWVRGEGQPDAPISPESPDWPVIVPAADGDGFEVTPPRAWQTIQPALFGIGWIDAYR